jgi:hypothetical protein
MRRLCILFLLILASCSGEIKPKGFIELSIEEWADSLSRNTQVKLTKTIYSSGISEEQEINNIDWEEEFALFRKYNLQKIEKKGDLIFDTIFDERTNRYLLRGMRIEQGPGIQSLYLVMDSLRQLLQFRISETEDTWLKTSEREAFWNTEGEYSYIIKTDYSYAKNEDLQIFVAWE